MKKNTISKIALLTGLLMINTNTKGFYQCIPKRSWIANVIDFRQWVKILDLRITSPLEDFKGFLEPGKYRVKAAGAGGEGEVKEFILRKKEEFKACVGAGGGGGGGCGLNIWYYYKNAGGGGGGGGGKGYAGYYSGSKGEDGSEGCNGGEGGNGGGGNGGNGYRLYNDIEGGKGGMGGGKGGNNGSSGLNNCRSNCSNGNYGRRKLYFNLPGMGGYGCSGGKGGRSSSYNSGGGGGGGGGSYFKIADVELMLKGGDGNPGYVQDDRCNGGDGAGPDGYVIVERWE